MVNRLCVLYGKELETVEDSTEDAVVAEKHPYLKVFTLKIRYSLEFMDFSSISRASSNCQNIQTKWRRPCAKKDSGTELRTSGRDGCLAYRLREMRSGIRQFICQSWERRNFWNGAAKRQTARGRNCSSWVGLDRRFSIDDDIWELKQMSRISRWPTA